MIAIERILRLLAYLTALVGVAPVLVYLDPLPQLGLLLALIAGIVADRQGRYWLPALPATLLSFLFFFSYLAQVSRSYLVEPLVNMLVLLLAVRLATVKSGRNLLQIFVLATFILAASSLLSLNLAYLVYLISLVILVTLGLVLTSFHATEVSLQLSRRQWRTLLPTALLLPTGSLLLMLLFFAILPRTQHPLWDFLNPVVKATIGFSDQVKPGSVAGLAETGEIAFRAEVEPLPAGQLYWRGIVLNQVAGPLWTRQGRLPAELLEPGRGGVRAQTIFAEPKRDRYLYSLDLPRRLSGIAASRADDGVYRARRRLEKRTRYQAGSVPGGRLRLTDNGDERFYLQLPKQVAPRVAAVAERIRQQGRSRAERLALLEQFFIAQQLSYSSTGLPRSETPVATFLFDTRRGYCEYFASSFALLARLVGIPARLVGGYLGGTYNELGGYYLVGEELAHVWVELLDKEGNWQRYDPSRLAENAEAGLLERRRRSIPWYQILQDSLDHYWNRAVIGYDLQQQLRMLNESSRTLRRLKLDLPASRWQWSGGLILLAGLVFVAVYLWRRPDAESRLLLRYRRQVARSAQLQELPAACGLFQLASLSGEPLCREFAEIYGLAIYAEQPLTAVQRKRLRQIVRQLKRVRLQLDMSDWGKTLFAPAGKLS